MTHEGRMWLYRVIIRLGVMVALEEDPFWARELLRAMILVHRLRETGKAVKL